MAGSAAVHLHRPAPAPCLSCCLLPLCLLLGFDLTAPDS